MCNLDEGIFEDGMELATKIVKLIFMGTADNTKLAA